MTTKELAPLASWLTEPLPVDVLRSVDRLRAADDVLHVALMPDIHLARDVCIGAVAATERLLYPAAVGGDIGCGMAAVAFDAPAAILAADRPDSERHAAHVLAGLYEGAPSNKHRSPRDLPSALGAGVLSCPRLARAAAREGRVQLGTLGRGNHFLELQTDSPHAPSDGRLWALAHSGSRAMGQLIASHHGAIATRGAGGLAWLDSTTDAGRAYLSDAAWARRYAGANRLAMLQAVEQLFGRLFGVTADWATLIHSDHNHVQREEHAGRRLWVHRKGAQPAAVETPGVIPGSMGAPTFHTLGRGLPESLDSSSHGAGRRLSRTEAQRQITPRAFARQVGDLWYDHRRAARLRDEAPAAYKDIHQVMRAQRQLTRIVRELRPVLSYKGT